MPPFAYVLHNYSDMRREFLYVQLNNYQRKTENACAIFESVIDIYIIFLYNMNKKRKKV